MGEWKKADSFDQKLADSYIGKTILIGIKYQDARDHFLENEQLHGIIESASPCFIGVRLRGTHRSVNGKYIGDNIWKMAPLLSVIKIAEPGFYELNNTGDTVDNPDLIATWLVTRPTKH